jgi:hypothetical protein
LNPQKVSNLFGENAKTKRRRKGKAAKEKRQQSPKEMKRNQVSGV